MERGVWVRMRQRAHSHSCANPHTMCGWNTHSDKYLQTRRRMLRSVCVFLLVCGIYQAYYMTKWQDNWRLHNWFENNPMHCIPNKYLTNTHTHTYTGWRVCTLCLTNVTRNIAHMFLWSPGYLPGPWTSHSLVWIMLQSLNSLRMPCIIYVEREYLKIIYNRPLNRLIVFALRKSSSQFLRCYARVCILCCIQLHCSHVCLHVVITNVIHLTIHLFAWWRHTQLVQCFIRASR